MARSVPTTRNMPSANSTSPASASNRCAVAAPALLDRLVAGERGGAARHHDRARGDARRAGRHLVAVAFHEPTPRGIDAEPLRHQRHERGQMALPHRLRAGAQRHLAVRLEPQIDGLVENAAGDFEEAADADAAQLLRLLGRRAPRREAVPVRERQRPVEKRARNRRCRRSGRSGVWYGMADGGIMLRRRSSARSMFIARAAASISRSIR